MSILQQLYKESTETKETVENINETLNSLYSLRKKEAKEEEKERNALDVIRKRQLRDGKRMFFDNQRFKEEGEKEEKKEKKSFIQRLLEGIGKLIGPLLTGLKALPGLVTSGLAQLGIGSMFGKLGLKTLLTTGLKALLLKGFIAAGVAAVAYAVLRMGQGVSNSITELAGGSARTEDGISYTMDDVRSIGHGEYGYERTQEQFDAGYNLGLSMKAKKTANDQIYRDNKEKDGLAARIRELEIKEKAGVLSGGAFGTGEVDELRNLRTRRDNLDKRIAENEKKKADMDKEIKKLWAQLGVSDAELLDIQVRSGRRSIDDVPERYVDQVGNAPGFWGSLWNTLNLRPRDVEYTDNVQNNQTGGLVHLQAGGVFTVPGHGNGDQVPMALPSGSFVLNRNASAMLQNGGVAPQVNTLLEPGEKVFMPGTWETNGIQQLNQDVPRKGPGSMQQPERRQVGGSVGKAVAHIKKDEALSSLSAGENDFIKPGGFSVRSNTPWGDINGGTKLHAYGDRYGIPTIGWGNTFYDSIRNGKQPVKMGDTIDKAKADNIMNVNVSSLATDYSQEIPNWSKMSDSQQAGLISMGYNAPNFYSSNTFAPNLKSAINDGDMSKAADNLSWGGPSPTRIAESQAMLRQGPMDLTKVPSYKVSGKTNATMPSNPPGQLGAKQPSLIDRAKNMLGLQTGGMVNTLLEPGEKVFMPGTWENNGVAEMNQSIPRHGAAPLRRQTGGVVEASHPDTGTGWSVGKDSQGRPAVFSKPAAQAFMESMKASKGIVKPSDITSSTRSSAKNKAVGGVANSNHLYGNAVDIHGASKAWLKENGTSHGWKNLVYSGHDGHFDFTGGGQLTPAPGDGREQTAVGDTDSSPTDPLNLGGLFSNAGTYASTLLGGIGDGLGLSFIGDIAGVLGGQHRTDGKKGEMWDFSAPANNRESIQPKPSETTERMSALQQDSNVATAQSVRPVVISSGSGGSQQPQGEFTVDGSAHTDIPSLPDGPSSSAQADYFYRLPLGGVL